MSIRDALKDELELEGLFRPHHSFLTAWLEVAGQEPWKSIPLDLCASLVRRACFALSKARSDHKAGGTDSWVHQCEKDREILREMLAHVKALGERYWYDYNQVHWELCNDECANVDLAEAELSRLSDNLSWCKRESKALIEAIRRPIPQPTVWVGNRAGSDKRLFILRLAQVMEDLLGGTREDLIVEIVGFAYGESKDGKYDDLVHNTRMAAARKLGQVNSRLKEV
jgi:hypothetical protein